MLALSFLLGKRLPLWDQAAVGESDIATYDLDSPLLTRTENPLFWDFSSAFMMSKEAEFLSMAKTSGM